MVILTFERDPEVFRRALDSVASQTLLPAEIIVADSGMDAEISRRIKEISRLHIDGVRVRYVAVRDARAGNERNIASTHCTKGWIAFLDDDDEWYPDKLERQMKAVPEGTSLIASPYDLEADGEVAHFIQDKGKISDGRSILGENVIGCTSMQVADKVLFDRVHGFDPRFRANQEWDLWIRLCRVGGVHIVDGSAGLKHVGKDTISSNPKRRMKGWRDMIRYHFKEYVREPSQFARMLWFVCMDHVRFRRRLGAVLWFSVYCAVSFAAKVHGRLRKG